MRPEGLLCEAERDPWAIANKFLVNFATTERSESPSSVNAAMVCIIHSGSIWWLSCAFVCYLGVNLLP